MQQKNVDIVITGGGSGGHIAPVRAVVPVLRKRHPNLELHWIGSAEMEQNAAAQLEIPFTQIPAGKLRRYLSWRNVTDIFRVKVGLVKAWLLLGKLRPRLVVSTGGFVSVPVVLAAWLRRIPVITHEQTVAMGLANKINSTFAKEVLLGFKEAELTVPKRSRDKVKYVGNPVRADLFGGTRSELLSWLRVSLPAELPIIYVTGGSLGAQVLNNATKEMIGELAKEAFVIHQCGRADYADLQDWYETLPEETRNNYRLYDFIREPLRDIYAAADLVVSRSGANTVNELMVFDLPAVVVPLEPTSGNEQLLHAKLLETKGQAVVVRQAEVTGEKLLAAIRSELTHVADRPRTPAQNDLSVERFADRIHFYVA